MWQINSTTTCDCELPRAATWIHKISKGTVSPNISRSRVHIDGKRRSSTSARDEVVDVRDDPDIHNWRDSLKCGVVIVLLTSFCRCGTKAQFTVVSAISGSVSVELEHDKNSVYCDAKTQLVCRQYADEINPQNI